MPKEAKWPNRRNALKGSNIKHKLKEKSMRQGKRMRAGTRNYSFFPPWPLNALLKFSL
jgi:hypothetical protein